MRSSVRVMSIGAKPSRRSGARSEERKVMRSQRPSVRGLARKVRRERRSGLVVSWRLKSRT